MSFEKDITEIRKLIEEEQRTNTETTLGIPSEPTSLFNPDVELFLRKRNLLNGVEGGVETMPTEAPPVTKPEAPTKQPEKPRSPIRPVPGVHPKPKALVSPVVEAKPKKKEYDLSVVPPEKQQWIQTGDETLNKILPGLPPEQRDYLIKISSDSYTELVDRVEEFTGLKVTRQNVPQLVGLMMAALQEVKAIEARNKNMFEELALELVFSIPEFKVVEQDYLDDNIKIDAKLEAADLSRLTQPAEPENPSELEGLTKDENLNLKMAEFLENATDEDIRRRFSNLMTSGGAVSKLYLFHMVAERLKRMDPRLPELYGVLAVMVHLGYWISPLGVEKLAASNEATSAGSEEVIPEGDKYIIKARGITFPFLVHEIVKGFSEYIALDPNQQIAMQKDKVEDETVDFMAGPGIYKSVFSYLPANEQELLPLVQKKLTSMGPAEIRDVIAKSPRGKEIMNGLIDAARKEWAQYQTAREEYKNR